MLVRRLVASLAVMGVLIAPATAPSAPANPFFSPSTLPFGAPPFDRIKDSDYQPAIEAGMAQQLQEVNAIANNAAPPTFENTILALEKSGRLLDRVTTIFFNIAGANTNDALDKVQEIEAPKLAVHGDKITLNSKLFARISAVYAQRAKLNLDPESRRLLDVTYQNFAQNGARLKPDQKAKLEKVDEQLSTLTTKFQEQLLAADKAGALIVSDKAKLAGLSDNALASAAQAAASRKLSGQWLVGLQNTTQQPSLASLDDRSMREQVMQNSLNRAEHNDASDTRDTIATIAMLRAQKAAILGYPNFASYALTSQMAKSPEHVLNFLRGLIPATRAKVIADAAELQSQVDKDGGGFQLAAYDWQKYANEVRKTKFNLDDSEVRPYFELNNVLTNGMFYTANRLYGITFKERKDIPVYNSDVRAFEVFDKNDKPLALMYFDFFKRDNKQGGAWMNNYVQQSTLFGTRPVISNVLNIPKPAPGQPCLLTPDNVVGLFHEFGHALNGYFATQKYESLSGTSTPRDFVEYPSQFNEHWALYPEVLKHYAFNYKTGEAMPQSLFDKIQKARSFDQGYGLAETLAADELDMAWHMLPASAPKQDVDQFETGALAKSGTDFANVPPRYRSSYFAHIWGGGYAAGY
jgi:peptidyl-dipeptidase Dcp